MWAPAGRRTLVPFTPPSASQWRVWSVSVVFSHHFERANNIAHSPAFTLKYEISGVLKSQTWPTWLQHKHHPRVLLYLHGSPLGEGDHKVLPLPVLIHHMGEDDMPVAAGPRQLGAICRPGQAEHAARVGFLQRVRPLGLGDEREQQLMDADIYRQL